MKYIPATPAERERMLAAVGVGTVEDLFQDIPQEVRLKRPLDLPAPVADPDLLAHMRQLAERNMDCDRLACFLGAGAYDHFVPSTVPHLALRPEFLTAYTPYQAEIMQGELQAIYEYQSMMCELTGMDVANASMYDGASATGEAASMAADLTKRAEILISTAVHPGVPAGAADLHQPPSDHRARAARGERRHRRRGGARGDLGRDRGADRPVAELLRVRSRTARRSPRPPTTTAHCSSSRSPNRSAWGCCAPPGAYGADIVTGEGQPLGNALNFGGPYLGMIATRERSCAGSPAASWAAPWTPRAGPGTCSRCRRASSTSGGPRRRATSARTSR